MTICRRIYVASALAACLLTCSCASTYNSRARSAHAALFRGDYERAADLIEKVRPALRDRLLHLMDTGMILHAAGRYEESNKALTEAERLSEAFTAKSISREASAALWSEEAVNYAGERHERVLIPVMRMLNYILLDRWDGALVEVRRIENVAERVYGKPGGPPNAFATYLSAVVWEAMGHINDAFIDYRRTGRLDGGLPYYGPDMKYSAIRSGLPAQLPPKDSGAWRAPENYRKKDGEILVVVESGRSPQFVSVPAAVGLYTLHMPAVVSWPQGAHGATVFVDGSPVGKTHTFYSIGEDIMEALRDRRKRALVRKTIKTAVQTGAYAAGIKLMEEEKTESQLAGLALILLGISMSAAERADERSWRTLPASLEIGRFFVSPGKRDVRVSPEGGGDPVEVSLDVGTERPSVVLARFGAGMRGIERPKPEDPGRIAAAKSKQREIEERMRREPGKGDLKIGLAYARMEAGDYDVERLLTEGMRAAEDKREALLGLVIANMVKGNYRAASRWAEEGADLGGRDKARFAAYAAAAGSLAGGEKAAIERPMEEGRGLAQAFDWFVTGLMDESEGKYKEATERFVKAHVLGLTGKPVEKRVMESFKRCDDSFKKSPAAEALMEDFAESMMM